jgi:hypothetical protein
MLSSDNVPSQFGPLIEWHGGDCPVHPDTVVRFHYRNGRSGIDFAIPQDLREGLAAKYADLIWMHAPLPGRSKPENDIVAYEVLNG